MGFSQRNFESDWWAAQSEGARVAASSSGVELLESDAQGDPITQNSDIQTFITRGVGAVIINPADPRGVAPSVTALKQANIPFVAVNSNLDESLASSAYCYVAEDQEATAAGVGAELAAVMESRIASDAPVKAVMIGGFPGELVTELRTAGFMEGYQSVTGAPELNMLPTVYGEWTADAALAPLREVATANPDLQLLFVASDSMLPSVQSALTSMGMWDTAIIGTYDGAMSTVQFMIDNPEGPIFADGANSPDVQGEVAVEMAKAAIDGVPQSEACPGGVKYIDTPLYTPANAGESFKPGAKF
ncbi:MAG: substrate-binding domain-containing protein [Microcella pacifica]